MMEDHAKTASPATVLRTVALLGTGYVAIAWLTIEFVQKRPFASIFESETSVPAQLAIGLAAGSAAALIQWLLLAFWPRWNRAQMRAVSGSAGLFGSPGTIVILALIVGVTEEVLFRAAIQPLTGILPAAVLFTVVHLGNVVRTDQERPLDHTVVAIAVASLFVVSLAVGALFESFGLLASVAAHFIYDTIVLFAYRAHFFRSRSAGWRGSN